jgi:hypothetical protein
MRPRPGTFAAPLAALAFALAGCGGGGTSAPTTVGGPPPTPAATSTPTLSGASIAITPNSIIFANGQAGAQTFTVTESGGAATPVLDRQSCAGIVQISQGSAGGTSQTYTVIPSSNGGGCTVVFVSGQNVATLGIAINGSPGYSGPQQVQTVPTALSFTSAGAAPQTLVAIASGQPSGVSPGTVSVDASACAGIANVSGGGTAPVGFTVTPVGNGGCALAVLDGFAAVTVPVTVAQGGTNAAVTLSTTSMTFATPNAPPQTVTVGFAGFVGTVTVNASGCEGLATLTIPNGSLPQTGTVTPLDTGVCTIIFSPSNGVPASLSITIQ